METLKRYALSLPSRIASKTVPRFALSLIFVAGVVACGNKDGGTANVPPVVGIEGCQNCAGLGTPVAITKFISEGSSGRLQLQNMTMFGSAAGYNQGASGSTYNLYSGNISVQGTLVIPQQISSYNSNNYNTGCVVPAGSYVVQTYTMGSVYLAGSFTVPDLVAGAMRLRMTNGLLYKDSSTGAIRWSGDLEIVSMNGMPCSNFGSYMN